MPPSRRGRASRTPRVPDINNAYDGGFGYQPRNIYKGKRQGAGRAFLHPVKDRSNLDIRTGVTVLRLLFQGSRAIGVRVRESDGERDLLTNGEIVLSAGAIETPRLLQLSGVGDGARLQKLGIPVVAHSPEVGLNMQEHLYLQVQYRVTEGSMNARLSSIASSGPAQWLEGLRYMMSKKGVLSDGAHELSGFVKTRPDSSRPDAHLGVSLYSMKITDKGFEWDADPGMTFGAYPMRPESRGHILIRSPDPEGALDIDSNYLATEQDRADAVSTVRYIRKIAGQDALRPFVREELSPGAEVDSDEDITRIFGEQGMRGFHVCSTARMGGDEYSVVDPQLRVRGVQGLRVVDTSIFPAITSGNTNAPVMAVALRASQIILGENDLGIW
jgi:choline dehydrogenase